MRITASFLSLWAVLSTAEATGSVNANPITTSQASAAHEFVVNPGTNNGSNGNAFEGHPTHRAVRRRRAQRQRKASDQVLFQKKTEHVANEDAQFWERFLQAGSLPPPTPPAPTPPAPTPPAPTPPPTSPPEPSSPCPTSVRQTIYVWIFGWLCCIVFSLLSHSFMVSFLLSLYIIFILHDIM